MGDGRGVAVGDGRGVAVGEADGRGVALGGVDGRGVAVGSTLPLGRGDGDPVAFALAVGLGDATDASEFKGLTTPPPPPPPQPAAKMHAPTQINAAVGNDVYAL